jgi:hypothetical protein
MKRKKTMTAQLRKQLKKVGIVKRKQYSFMFSDPRKHKTAIGIKCVGLQKMTTAQSEKVIKKMGKKGFEFVKLTDPYVGKMSWMDAFSGYRFTFMKNKNY